MAANVEIQPCGGYISVEEAAKDKISGLVIPDTYKGLFQKGTVIAVGPQAEGVVPGDTVYYSKNNGSIIEGVKLILAVDLLAKIPKDVTKNV